MTPPARKAGAKNVRVPSVGGRGAKGLAKEAGTRRAGGQRGAQPLDTGPDLRRMQMFAAVVDAGGFSAAARQLGVSKAAVSKQVQRLEAQYGVQLLHRTTRAVGLTEAGARFYRDCAAAVSAAEEALEGLAQMGEQPRGMLRVSAPIGIGEMFLAPVLAAFMARHPELQVELKVEDAVVDLIAEGFDVALRGGQLQDSSLMARKIAPLSLVVCTSPAYLARMGTPRRPRDLAQHDWITYSPMGVSSRLTFRRNGKRTVVRPQGRMVTNNGEVIRTLLREGHGISLLPAFYIAQDLKEGRLLQLFAEYTLGAAALYAVYPSTRYVPLKVRAFIDFLVESQRVRS